MQTNRFLDIRERAAHPPTRGKLRDGTGGSRRSARRDLGPRSQPDITSAGSLLHGQLIIAVLLAGEAPVEPFDHAVELKQFGFCAVQFGDDPTGANSRFARDRRAP